MGWSVCSLKASSPEAGSSETVNPSKANYRGERRSKSGSAMSHRYSTILML